MCSTILLAAGLFVVVRSIIVPKLGYECRASIGSGTIWNTKVADLTIQEGLDTVLRGGLFHEDFFRPVYGVSVGSEQLLVAVRRW